MFHTRSFCWLFLMMIGGLLLAACGGEPQRIAEAPRQVSEATQSRHCVAGGNHIDAVLHAEMLFSTWEVDRIAESANRIARQYDGYQLSSETCYQGRDKSITLTLAVPTMRFEDLESELADLDSLSYERQTWKQSGRRRAISPNTDWNTESTITLYFTPPTAQGSREPIAQPVESPTPISVSPDARPLRTLKSAFAVTSAIFLFLLDMGIWIGAVIGPFLLIGFVVRWLYIRYWPWGIVERPIKRLEERE